MVRNRLNQVRQPGALLESRPAVGVEPEDAHRTDIVGRCRQIHDETAGEQIVPFVLRRRVLPDEILKGVAVYPT